MLSLSGLFSDHAVFQSGVPVPVWGNAAPFTLVRCKMNGLTACGLAGEDGCFLLRLPAMEPGGPYTVRISAGAEEICLRDVFVGEVWIGSGQSNMEWTFDQMDHTDPAEIAACASCPGIRMLTVEHSARTAPRRTIRAAWQVSSPDVIGGWSAVCTFFAAKLHRDLGVAVGVINSSWGGSIAEAWTAYEALCRNPEYAALLNAYESKISSEGHWLERKELSTALTFEEIESMTVRKYAAPDPPNTGLESGWAEPSCDTADWKSCELPGIWQKRLGWECNGTVWFRREMELPDAWIGRPLTLELGAADKHDIAYCGGQEIGRTGQGTEMEHWNIPRIYQIPPALAVKRIVLAVRVRSFACDGGLIGPADRMKLYPSDAPEQTLDLTGTWLAKLEHDTGKLPMYSLRMGDGNPNSFHILFDNMIAPLIPYAVRGVIWYQGEANESSASAYRELLCSLIFDWRRRWGLGDFPFIQMLLAGYREAKEFDASAQWPYLREAQIQSSLATGNLFASAVDIGETDNIHPRYKRLAGERFAQTAERQAYHFSNVPRNPLPVRFVRGGDALLVEFDVSGLSTSDGNPVRTLYAAGTDGIFFPATGEILPGGVLKITSPDFTPPVSVRYAWSDHPASANLTDSDGTPVPPFRF